MTAPSSLYAGSGTATPVARSQTPIGDTASGDTSEMQSKKQVLAQLGIPAYLAERPKGNNLPLAYKKYKAVIEATQTYNAMSANGTWKGEKLDRTKIIDLFISKSFYFSHYQSCFQKVADHPLLLQWLEKEDRGADPTDLDVWGEVRSSYGFTELMKFLEGFKKKGKKGKAKEGKGESSKQKKESGSSSCHSTTWRYFISRYYFQSLQ